MSKNSETVSDRLNRAYDTLTRAERQLASSILSNYPVSALGSITAVAQDAGVSTPTVARMVQKLGFKGFPEFQAEVRLELEAKITGPIAKHDSWVGSAPDEHILNRFTEIVINNIRQSLAQIEPETFDQSCELIADTDRRLYIAGGRITRALADYFFLHMQVIRPKVTHVQSISNAWPHYILDMNKGDVLVLFDIRRYETSLLRMAEMAKERGVEIILFTDQWRSPAAQYAKHSFNCRIEAPSAWDSNAAIMLLIESVIAQTQEVNWSSTRPRMEELETYFDRTKTFRKFS
ncbi:MurR/RpiR family transcriptional regulator [Kiloniella sp. b19]|uniref:MurR/RpiR family transcriptional regulator n=1 Tax=Kiloniella sp. GXU_MW_B19 TaxID=3141326 RepID=UPI0031D154D2